MPCLTVESDDKDPPAQAQAQAQKFDSHEDPNSASWRCIQKPSTKQKEIGKKIYIPFFQRVLLVHFTNCFFGM